MTTKAQIIELLKTNDKAVARALVVLNERQTQDEQASQNTKYHNGRGFRPCHARMGTSMAQFYLRRGFLTAKQIAYFRMKDKTGKMRIEIYAGQLLEVAEANAAKKAAVAKTAALSAGLPVVEMKVETLDPQDCKGIPIVVDGEQLEREMQAMEEQGDREQTAREEAAKFAAKQVMERAPMSSWDAIFAKVK